MVTYTSAYDYIESCTDLDAKIAGIDAIIAALEGTMLKVATGNISEYMLNDGQTIIKTSYSNINQLTQAMDAMEAIRQRYINRKTGRITRLVDSKNMHRWPGY